MALLPVLIMTGLITVVVLLLFSLSNNLLRTSSGQSASYQTTALRDMAINMAIAQLRQGTTEPNALWISQPGALRTYDNSSGAASNVYKLYSNRNMVVQASTLDTPSKLNLEDDVPSDAPNKGDVFANLNSHSTDATGKMYFPIMDPRTMDVLNPVYPGSATPEGFKYSNYQAVSNVFTNGTYAPSSTYGANTQRLAMNVHWIYLLADGSMGVIDQYSRTFVPFSGQNKASATNPMVGRFAFWTDDESCKINVNTASEGIYWDTPRCATKQEIAFAKQPPVNMEVQRYGGHPATTCLSSFFYPGQRFDPHNSSDAMKLMDIYDMTPRVSYKDKNGTPTGAFLPVPNAATTVNPVVLPMPLKRLYASVDDFALTPDRKEQPIFTAKPNLRDRMRFFLTAESRAPEITASGHPKISLWPVYYNYNDLTRSTVFDNLIRFCSTLGNTPYHFRRVNSLSNVQDFVNNTGVNYINSGNDPMGIGPICNANLTLYLIELAKQTKHGYPISFAAKFDSSPLNPYNTSTGLLDCMEYIHQTNITDTTSATGGSPVIPFVSPWNATWIGSDVSGQVNAQDIGHYPAPLNSINMLKNATDQIWTNGIGREYTISEFGLDILVAAERLADDTKFNPTLVDALKLPKGYKAIQIAPLLEGFCPGQGYASIAPSSAVKLLYLNTLTLTLKSNPLISAKAGGAVIASSVPPIFNQNVNTYFGAINPSVAHLGYKTGVKATYQTSDPDKKSDAKWWVPWGGSGGRWMYEDDNSTLQINDPTLTSNAKDATQVGGVPPTAPLELDDPNRKIIPYYTRGYFIIPSTEQFVTLQSNLPGADVAGCMEIAYGNQRNGDTSGHRLFIQVPPTIIPVPQRPTQPTSVVSFGQRLLNAQANRYLNPEVVDPNDVVRTWVVRHGDHRLTYVHMNESNGGFNDPKAVTGFLDANKLFFIPHPDWDPAGTNYVASQQKKQIHSFTKSGGIPEQVALGDPSNATFVRGLVKGVTYGTNVKPDFTVDPANARFKANVPATYPYLVDPSDTRDWDNGTGIAPDGAYWNKPDDVAKVWDGTIPPYFSNRVWDGAIPDAVNQTTAPNQMIPSAVMFGSINSAPSTGVQWTTYLFRPDITIGGHLGSKNNSIMGTLTGAPPDHVMLDWFWMPVAQPYAVSEPFSTAGKINMNYRIVPFTHIKRATGMHAVLKSEQILAIPTSAGQTYKDYTKAGNNGNWRKYIDSAQTLLQWEEKFNNGQFFKNASEVCEQFLVPLNAGINAASGASVRTQMTTYWNNNQLSGDNTLERPYANIYPRLTTRSNTYRVHYLVQTITKGRSSDPTKFTGSKDTITGEAQGDALVERAIDPNDPALSTSDYKYITPNGDATATINLTGTKSLDNLFIWRIRNIHRFSK